MMTRARSGHGAQARVADGDPAGPGPPGATKAAPVPALALKRQGRTASNTAPRLPGPRPAARSSTARNHVTQPVRLQALLFDRWAGAGVPSRSATPAAS